MRYPAAVTLAALCQLAALAAPPEVTIPPDQLKPVNGYVMMTPGGTAKGFSYLSMGGTAFPLPPALLADKTMFVLPVAGLAAGKYDFVAVGSLNDEHRTTPFSVLIGPPPGPTPTPTPVPPQPTPTPTPTPDADPPIPGDGNRVMIVFETEDLSKYPRGQVNAMYADDVRAYLDAKCAPGPDGTAEWRMLDKNTDMTNETKTWQDAMTRANTKRTKWKPVKNAKGEIVGPASLPWVIVSNGKTGFEGPLPYNEKDPTDITPFMNLLKKYGGP